MKSSTESAWPIFLVDDEEPLLDSLGMTLLAAGFGNVETFTDGQAVLDRLPDVRCALLLLDLFMPGRVPGEEILERFRSEAPHVPVVVITGVDEAGTAVRCMKAGAFDYLIKPVEQALLLATVRRALDHARLLRQNIHLRDKLLTERLDQPEAFNGIITENRRMQAIFRYMEVIAPTVEPVLITGETGTGKDLMATALHRLSGRGGPFVAVNVAGLDDNMFADTLFGHVKGAFTDAGQERRGMVEQAAGGTLFLDEIGDLSLGSQVKLLKLIQDHEYLPLGAERPHRSRARIVAATNQDLEIAERKGLFRKDLFYRINTYHVHLPPLRERGRDVLLLAEHYLRQACDSLKVPCGRIDPLLADRLLSHPFPGNVRELRSLIFNTMAQGGVQALEKNMAALIKTPVRHPDVPASAPEPGPAQIPAQGTDILFPDPLPTMDQTLQELVREALRRSGGNQAAAARMLGISRQAMHQRLSQRR
ncbi:two component, sigma54 specific, transcriptional regulator, Fis family [Desulfonatronum zhilinae]|nr:two component, sigma54 specific, transcriptional regulator, Fis family [Desulfonatronum zhilinae]